MTKKSICCHSNFLSFSFTHSFSQEVSRQMNSVFKELLSRQPPLEASGSSAPPSSPPASTPAVSSITSRPSVKKGFGLRSRGLFKAQEQQDWWKMIVILIIEWVLGQQWIHHKYEYIFPDVQYGSLYALLTQVYQKIFRVLFLCESLILLLVVFVF